MCLTAGSSETHAHAAYTSCTPGSVASKSGSSRRCAAESDHALVRHQVLVLHLLWSRMRTKAHEYHTHGAHRSGIKSLSLILCIRMYGYVGMCAVCAPVCVYICILAKQSSPCPSSSVVSATVGCVGTEGTGVCLCVYVQECCRVSMCASESV